jgi:hypothetical protein
VIERLALAEWSRQHGFALVRLPTVRGKRQTANAKLITAISKSVSVHLNCDDQVRNCFARDDKELGSQLGETITRRTAS